jgi:dipeptidase E
MPDLSLNSLERSATKTGVSVKLYLSSYRLGKEPSGLSALCAKNRRVAIIRNALDIYTDEKRLREGLEREVADMEAIGLLPEPLDLRQFFGKENLLNEIVDGFGYLWVVGGNSFVLRRAFKRTRCNSRA